jgi:endonuclease/exonuclease/phosphatase (EEP) superfamily protein YafD
MRAERSAWRSAAQSRHHARRWDAEVRLIGRRWVGSVAAQVGTLVAALSLVACATIPDDERMLMPQLDGGVAAVAQPCSATRTVKPMAVRVGFEALAAAPTLRVMSWNLHKSEDEGWEVDLARYAAAHDLVLLQEAVMTDAVRSVLERAGHDWLMAGAFAWNGQERGVLVAARARAVDGCTLRSFEPLFPLPKSALVVRFRLAGGTTIAVANLHGVNFTLGLERFRDQLEAVAAELERHDGPAILAGDFNTWSQSRQEVLAEVALRLQLKAVVPSPDARRVALGQHLDHVYVRGLRVVSATAPKVTSSDHNPILVELELR